MKKQIAFLLLAFLILGAGASAAAPAITSVSFNPPSGWVKIGGSITMTISANASGYTAGTITVNGVATTLFTDNNDNTYTVTYTVAEGHTDIAEDATIPISVELCNGVEGCNVPVFTISPDADSSPAIDAHKPTLNPVTIVSNNADPTKAKVVNEITVAFTTSEVLTADLNVTIATKPATVTSAGNNYTAKYTMQAVDTEGIIPFTINFTDSAGNAGTQVTVSTNGTNITFDKTVPTYVSGAYVSNTEIELIFSEQMAGGLAGEFTLGAGTVTAIQIQTDKTKIKLTITGGNSSVATTVSRTGTTLTDLAGNALVNLVNNPVSANAAPVASSVSVLPSSPATSDTLTCNYTYTDADPAGTAIFKWFVNGAPTSNTSQTLASNQTSVGQTWICQVRPVALTGTSPGLDVNSSAVTIANIATPVISSSTHEEDTWKASNDPAFSWTEVSGATNYYYVFDTVSDTIPGTSSNTRSSTSITFDNQSNGTHYFHVRANVGGELSGTDHYAIRIDDAAPGIPTGLSASYDSDDEEVNLDWTSGGDSGGSGIKYYKIYRGTVSGFGDMTKVGQTTGNGTEYSSYSSLTEGKRYYYRVTAVDVAGNESVESDYVSVIYGAAAPKPTVKLVSPLNEEVVNGVFEIRASATADSSTSIKEVRFYVDESLIGKGTKSGSYYVFDWNTFEEDDGTYELKATAIDKYDISSNPDSIDITIENADTQETEKVAAQTAIDSAEGSKESADALVAELASLGALPGEAAGGLIADALDLLDEAQALFNDVEYADAVVKADDAKAKFVQAVGMLAVEDYGEASDYVFNEEHLDIMLKNLGFSQQLRDEAKELLQGNDVARSLSFKKVEDGDKAYYKAVITLVVKNGSEEAMDVKVVEIVPKELAASASEIAGSGFVVLVDDPVLEWAVSLGAGEEKEIVYALKGELTAEEADDMVASGIINKFAVPPVLLKAGTNVEAMFSPVSAGLFGLGGTVEIVGVAIIIGAIVVFVVLYVAGRRGKSEGSSALDAAASRAGFGSGFFGKLGKKNEPSKQKWRYKGV